MKMKLMEAEHPTPRGYRRLQIGEIVLKTDLVNACDNVEPYISPEQPGGFITPKGSVGRNITSLSVLAAYRRAPSIWSRIFKTLFSGWRR